MMKKVLRMAQLFDTYGEFLTEKQQEFIRLYYEEDLSLGEIADEFKISRQAVYDVLRRGEDLLEEWEQKLGLVQGASMWRRDMDRVLELLAELEERVGRDRETLLLIRKIKALVNPF